MDNFIGTVVFLLPGFLMYFWIQAFGINPVTKHNPVEVTAISGLLWLPVSIMTLLLYNGIIEIAGWISNKRTVWTLEELKDNSSNLGFLIAFLALSVLVSFVISAVWAKWGYPLQRSVINKIRTWRGIAPFSKSPSVWDEVFLNNDSQVVEIGRLDKADSPTIIGCIDKASRTFEAERHIHLNDIDFFTKLVKDHNIPVSHVFYDTKSGTYIKIFDAEAIKNAQLDPISSEED